MNTNRIPIHAQSNHPQGTRLLAGICYHCSVCARANRKPGSRFERLMRWHRNWCPAWSAHSKVYGPKSLS